MSANYTPQTWADGSAGNTPILAATLAHIESGIGAVDTAAVAKPRGSLWYNDPGAPGVISGQLVNDQYRDTNTDDVYMFNGTTWVSTGNIGGIDGNQGPAGYLNELRQNSDGTWNVRATAPDPTIRVWWMWEIAGSAAPPVDAQHVKSTIPVDIVLDLRLS